MFWSAFDAAAIADDGGGGVFPLVFVSPFFVLDDFDLSGLIFAARKLGGGNWCSTLNLLDCCCFCCGTFCTAAKDEVVRAAAAGAATDDVIDDDDDCFFDGSFSNS